MWLKLHNPNNDFVWINTNNVETIRRSDRSNDIGRVLAEVVLVSGNIQVVVEPIELIIKEITSAA